MIAERAADLIRFGEQTGSFGTGYDASRDDDDDDEHRQRELVADQSSPDADNIAEVQDQTENQYMRASGRPAGYYYSDRMSEQQTNGTHSGARMLHFL